MKQKIEFENLHALETNRALRQLAGQQWEEGLLSLKRNRRQTVRDEGYPSFSRVNNRYEQMDSVPLV